MAATTTISKGNSGTLPLVDAVVTAEVVELTCEELDCVLVNELDELAEVVVVLVVLVLVELVVVLVEDVDVVEVETLDVVEVEVVEVTADEDQENVAVLKIGGP